MLEAPKPNERMSVLNNTLNLNSLFQRFHGRAPQQADAPVCLEYARGLAAGRTWAETKHAFASSPQFITRLRSLAATSPEQALTLMYNAVLERDVDDLARKMYGASLNADRGDINIKNILQGILTSEEYARKSVNDLYEELLGRGAEARGLEDKLREMREQGKTLDAVKRDIQDSDEYKQREARKKREQLELIVDGSPVVSI